MEPTSNDSQKITENLLKVLDIYSSKEKKLFTFPIQLMK